jgi:hypothetical protein
VLIIHFNQNVLRNPHKVKIDDKLLACTFGFYQFRMGTIGPVVRSFEGRTMRRKPAAEPPPEREAADTSGREALLTDTAESARLRLHIRRRPNLFGADDLLTGFAHKDKRQLKNGERIRM